METRMRGYLLAGKEDFLEPLMCGDLFSDDGIVGPDYLLRQLIS